MLPGTARPGLVGLRRRVCEFWRGLGQRLRADPKAPDFQALPYPSEGQIVWIIPGGRSIKDKGSKSPEPQKEPGP